MKNKIIISVFCFFVLVSALLLFLTLYIAPLELKKETFVYEYGKTEISTNVADYINANPKVISEAKLNFAEVKNEVGVYPASITYLSDVYHFYVKVVDTTKPVAKLKQVEFNFKRGTTVQAIDLLESVEDSSDSVAYFKTDDEVKVTSKSFDRDGVYVENIIVADSSNNISAMLRVKIVIGQTGNNPSIGGIETVTLKKGDAFDPLKDVKALDGKGNNITEKIKIIKNDVNINEEGIYEVIYTVTNSSGLSLQRSRKVIVK